MRHTRAHKLSNDRPTRKPACCPFTCTHAGIRAALQCTTHVCAGGKGRRQMVHVDQAGTVYLNAATVPRVRKPLPPAPVAVNGRRQKVTKSKRLQATHSSKAAAVAAALQSQAPTEHHFLVVEMEEGVVCRASDVWVEAQPLAEAGSGLPPAPAAQQGSESNKAALEAQGAGGSSGASTASRGSSDRRTGVSGGGSSSGGAGVATPGVSGEGVKGAALSHDALQHLCAEQRYSVRVAQDNEVYCRQAGAEMSEHRYYDASCGKHLTMHTTNGVAQAVPV